MHPNMKQFLENPLPMLTGCYARFSTDLQRDTSLEDQTRTCREYAERQGWTGDVP